MCSFHGAVSSICLLSERLKFLIVQRGYSVIPKSAKRERIQTNFKNLFELSQEDFDKINQITTRLRFVDFDEEWQEDLFASWPLD